MAYDKVYPQNGQSILAFDTNQEDRVASGFGDIADYVVERDPNNKWEKWSSGKLVQRDRVTKALTPAGILEITFPIPFLNANAYFTGQMLYVSVAHITCAASLPTTTGVNLYYRDSRNGDVITTTQGYSYEAVGRWK